MKKIRIEIKCKPGVYDSVSRALEKDIRDLGKKGVKKVEYVEIYTISGDLSEKAIKKIGAELLSDKISQQYSYYSEDKTKMPKGASVVEIAYNPGVMDPVQESAVKAINDMGIKIDELYTSKKYILYGKLQSSQVRDIADKLLYNKIIQHVVVPGEHKKGRSSYVFEYKEINILEASDAGLEKISREGQLYLNLEEMREIKKYFRSLRRNPSDCELETIAQTWSEHCKHKTLMGDILYEGKTIKNLLKQTVMKATTELNRSWCVSVFVDNAGIIRFDKDNNICFKVETHNHPSALEPYGGAETGIGGVLRDIMGTGLGAKPIANTDIFCFGMPDSSQGSVPKGALHPKRVMKGVVSGVRDYGNKMGIPTVNGTVCFDKRYTGNPLVFCGSIGIMPKDSSFKKVCPGDLIVAVGGRTGRDGIHGATFSSSELTTESETISSTAVQIGNPITEKKILDILLKARDMGLYDSITDCGAGGFSSAVGEMGEETGAEVHLDKAPLKYKGLQPWEIWISEAQERMVLAVKPKKWKKLSNLFAEEDVEAVIIGQFTDDKKLRLFYDNKKVAELDMSFLHDGVPRPLHEATWKKVKESSRVPFKKKAKLTSDLLKVLSSWNVCSKEWIVRQYDHEVQGGSILKPFVGVDNDGPSDAAIVRPVLGSKKGVVVSNGINPCYGDIDPYWMAASAIDEALRQIACVGGDIDKVAILDNFCWGNTEKPEQLGGVVRASQACYDIARVYKTPFISGKDSLNNEFNAGTKTIAIPPTLLISAFGVVDDVSKTISMDIKDPGNLIFVIGSTYQELGGSQYYLSKKIKGGVVPRVRPKDGFKIIKKVSAAVKKGYIRSAHDCSEGGIGVALAEMLFAGGYGAEVSLKDVPREKDVTRSDVVLFSESNSRFILEVVPGKEKQLLKEFKGIPLAKIGKVVDSDELIVKGMKNEVVVKVKLDKLKASWQKTIKEVMHE